MADAQLQSFGKRLGRISKRRGKLANGYVTVVNSDGLLVAQPKRTSLRFPWRAVAVTALLFFVFKGLLMASLGEAEYSERALSLQAGTPVEQVGGWVMQPDPMTLWIAEQFKSIL